MHSNRVSSVSFGYTDDRPLLQNFNFTAKMGKKYLIKGLSSCRKTTAINFPVVRGVKEIYQPLYQKLVDNMVERNTQYPKHKTNPNHLTGSDLRGLVEHRGVEPLASTMRM